MTPDPSHLPPRSPFLPGTNIQFAWDSTSLGYIKTCPRLYQYQMIEGWQAKDESVHLTFGIHYHQAIQDYDIARAEGDLSHEEAIRDSIRKVLIAARDFNPDRDTKAGKYKNRETLLQLLVDYFDKYGPNDPAQTFRLESGKAAVELSFKFELDWGPKASNQFRKVEGTEMVVDIPSQPYLLCGHLDRVVSFNDSLFVLDHKTTTMAPGDYFFDQFNPNNQMTIYSIAGQIVVNSPIKGVIVEAAQILLEKPNRFVRGFTYRTKETTDEWLAALAFWLDQAERFATANYWPMNDTACDKFGGCKFRGICSKAPGVRENFLKGGFTKLPVEERWNPLKPR